MNKILLLYLILFLTGCASGRPIQSDFSEAPLVRISKIKLLQDFDLLVNSLKEAHTGLYVYSTEQQFDSIATAQRQKIKSDLNSLQFYNIAAPIVAFTKEDHCDIKIAKDAAQHLKNKATFLPLYVVSLNNNIYILNDYYNLPLQGKALLSINDVPIEQIYRYIFGTFAADGFIETSKYRYLDIQGLSVEYAKTIELPEYFKIVVQNTTTGKKENYILKGTSKQQLLEVGTSLKKTGLLKEIALPATLEIKSDRAVLTINTFSNNNYKEAGMNFKSFIKNAFNRIHTEKIQDLIIDIRENGGGTEGNEDYLFSFLTDKPYNKYKYVRLSAFSFSFYQYTDYNKIEDRKELEDDLKGEHYLADDGQILRKPGVEQPAPLQKDPYLGRVYILTSGWTYSGGAEFTSLMKEHTNAIFIGEEPGGCFYGNTSGYGLELTLPHSGLTIDIPLLQFVLDVSNKAPFGRGVIPDYEVQPTISEFLNGIDAQMVFTHALIDKK